MPTSCWLNGISMYICNRPLNTRQDKQVMAVICLFRPGWSHLDAGGGGHQTDPVKLLLRLYAFKLRCQLILKGIASFVPQKLLCYYETWNMSWPICHQLARPSSRPMQLSVFVSVFWGWASWRPCRLGPALLSLQGPLKMQGVKGLASCLR